MMIKIQIKIIKKVKIVIFFNKVMIFSIFECVINMAKY